MILCKCGCGKEIIQKYSWRYTTYIKGHNRKGKHHSEEHKKKLSEAKIGDKNPMFGKHLSEERKKLCASFGKLNPMYGKVGENSANWRGGISFEPYCPKFNKALKEKIRERDERICQECGKTEIESKRKLDVHHIHYDKPNCDPHLISLCRVCNVKANGNRDYWEEHFMKN